MFDGSDNLVGAMEIVEHADLDFDADTRADVYEIEVADSFFEGVQIGEDMEKELRAARGLRKQT